jgi:hypothetical protein
MHEKLRHQLNIHKISGSYKMEQQNSASFIPFFFKKKKKKENKNMLHNKEDSIVQACKVKANLTSEREV